MKNITLRIIVLSFPLFFTGELLLFAQSKRLHNVGMAFRFYEDTARTNWLGTGFRKLNTIIWYPAQSGKTEYIAESQFSPLPVIMDGKLYGKKLNKYPLVLLSHGAGNNAVNMMWLGHYLAARSYITVSLDHSSDKNDRSKVGILNLNDTHMWERPKDISFILTQVLKDSVYRARIDSAKITAAGFSIGGYSVLGLAGAVINLKDLEENTAYSKNPESLPTELKKSIDQYLALTEQDTIIKKSIKKAEINLTDNRIKAVFAFAPAIGGAFLHTGLDKIDLPVLILVGDADRITPMELNAKVYANGIKNSKIIIIPGEVGHITMPIDPKTNTDNMLRVSKYAYEFFEKWNR